MSSNNNSNNIWKYIGIGAGIGAIGGAIIGGDVVGAVVGVFFGASGGTIVGANTPQPTNTSTSQSNIYTTPKKAPLVLKNWSKHGITSKSREEIIKDRRAIKGAIKSAIAGAILGAIASGASGGGGDAIWSSIALTIACTIWGATIGVSGARSSAIWGAINGAIWCAIWSVGAGLNVMEGAFFGAINGAITGAFFGAIASGGNVSIKDEDYKFKSLEIFREFYLGLTDRQVFIQNHLNNKTVLAYTIDTDRNSLVPMFKKYIQNGDADKVRLFVELGMVDSVEELKTYLANASSKLKLELQDLLGEDSISEKDMQQAIDSGYSASHGEMQRMFQRGLKSKNADMMKTAINNGYKASDEELLEMLNHSVESKNKDMIMFAIQHGADLFTQANPLIVSCEILQDVNFVQVSINKGYDIYQPHNGMTLIEYAFSQGNKAICELLFKTHGDVNTPFPSGESIMHLASKYDLSYLIKDTLKKGYDVNTLDQKGFTMLDYAVESKRVDVGLLLIDNGGLLA